MFDTYEKCLVLLGDPSIPLSKALGEMMLTYCAWASLTAVSQSELINAKETFIKQTYPGDGDGVDCALAIEDESIKEAALRFLLLEDGIWDKLGNVQLDQHPDKDKEARIKQGAMDPMVLSRLIGIEVQDASMTIHVSAAAPKLIKMHYFTELGVFLSIGADVHLDKDASYTKESFQCVFNALADASRLEIVRILLQESLTTSQIAQRVGVTQSTVNHHLKQLIEVGVVNLALTSKIGKGAVYKCNKAAMHELLVFLQRSLE